MAFPLLCARMPLVCTFLCLYMGNRKVCALGTPGYLISYWQTGKVFFWLSRSRSPTGRKKIDSREFSPKNGPKIKMVNPGESGKIEMGRKKKNGPKINNRKRSAQKTFLHLVGLYLDPTDLRAALWTTEASRLGLFSRSLISFQLI